MANVLPLDAQKQMRRLFRARFVVVGSLAAITGALFTFLALLPSATGLYSELLVPSDISGTPEKNTENEAERTEILRAQSLVTQFSTMVSSTTPSFEALMSALRARPAGALVEEVRYTKDGGKGTILIYGNAKDRTSVTHYRDALEKEARFEEILIPASALAGAEDGRFSITLKGSF